MLRLRVRLGVTVTVRVRVSVTQAYLSPSATTATLAIALWSAVICFGVPTHIQADRRTKNTEIIPNLSLV